MGPRFFWNAPNEKINCYLLVSTCNSRKKGGKHLSVDAWRYSQKRRNVCRPGRHICGSGECRVLLLFIVSVDLITVTEGYLIRKAWRHLLSPWGRTQEVKKTSEIKQEVTEIKQMSAGEEWGFNVAHHVLALSVTQMSSLPEGHGFRSGWSFLQRQNLQILGLSSNSIISNLLRNW